MFSLSGKQIYLSGPIEHSNFDDNWREEPKKVLREEFGLIVYDPFEKTALGKSERQITEELLTARANKDLEKMAVLAKAIVRRDMASLDHSHFVIANLPYKTSTAGTHCEILNGCNLKKPVLLLCEQGRAFLSAWYFGIVPIEVMFESWDGIYQYLRDVEAGKHQHNHRWNYPCGLV